MGVESSIVGQIEALKKLQPVEVAGRADTPHADNCKTVATRLFRIVETYASRVDDSDAINKARALSETIGTLPLGEKKWVESPIIGAHDPTKVQNIMFNAISAVNLGKYNFETGNAGTRYYNTKSPETKYFDPEEKETAEPLDLLRAILMSPNQEVLINLDGPPGREQTDKIYKCFIDPIFPDTIVIMQKLSKFESGRPATASEGIRMIFFEPAVYNTAITEAIIALQKKQEDADSRAKLAETRSTLP